MANASDGRAVRCGAVPWATYFDHIDQSVLAGHVRRSRVPYGAVATTDIGWTSRLGRPAPAILRQRRPAIDRAPRSISSTANTIPNSRMVTAGVLAVNRAEEYGYT